MTNFETVILENNIEYIIMNEKIIDNEKYLYLVNLNNSNDYVIRKEKGDLLIGLDNEEEFKKVISYLLNKRGI